MARSGGTRSASAKTSQMWHGLLDHPVAGAGAAGRQPSWPLIGPLLLVQARAGPRRAARVRPADQLDALAEAWVRAALEADVDDGRRRGSRGLDQPVAAFERDRQRLLGVKVLAGGELHRR